MSSTTDLRARPVGLPGLSAAAPEVRTLLRVLGVLLFVTAAASVHLWTRTQVRETALELDQARSALVRAQTQRDRLAVERTMLRAPGRLGALAVGLDLVAPEAVVDVAATARPAEAP